MINYTIIDGNITLYNDGVVTDISKAKNQDHFLKVLEFIKTKDLDGLKIYLDNKTPEKIIENFSEGEIVVRDGNIFIVGDWNPIPRTIASRIKEYIDYGISYKPLVAFWKNLRENPSASSREQLFTFLEKNKHPFTDDGCFIAYKKIKKIYIPKEELEGVYNEGKFAVVTIDGKDFIYVDSYSGQIDNSPGASPWMDRWAVDPNPDVTCSTGLHVAAWQYAQTYSGDCLVIVKVNPKDVVAVPIDYSNQKMRVCAYTVLSECAEELNGRDSVHFNENTEDNEPIFDDNSDDNNDDDYYCNKCGAESEEDCDCSGY